MSIVITGVGIVSTAGHDKENFWRKLYSGLNTYDSISKFIDEGYRYNVGAWIGEDSWKYRLAESILAKYEGRAALYAASAAVAAMDDAKIDAQSRKTYRIVNCIGTTMGEIDIEEKVSERIGQGIEMSAQRTLLKHYPSHLIARAVQEAIDSCESVSHIVPAACSGGNYAIAMGASLLERGSADVVLAGGVDVFSRVAFAGFQRLLSMDPICCRPFDAERKGLILGEGCGIVVMEREETARARGASVYGKLSGWGLTSDGYHMITPHPEGDGLRRAMNIAVRKAKIGRSDIDYISAHGTGTRQNDLTEVKGMKAFFCAEEIPPVSSIKSMLGHSLGAASALECIACLLMLQNQIILPTANLRNPDSTLNLDFVPNRPREARLRNILSNSLAFGGQVGSIVLQGGEYYV